jgi:hypothetical protein
MTYSAHEGDGQISRVHNMAICKEVGERLRTSLDQKPAPMSPHLLMLMARLREEPARIQPHPTQ